MILKTEAVQGYATWWKWTIRTPAGVLIEQSTMQFRSAATAEERGRTRLVELKERQRAGE